jgi:hypothetical protein
MPTTILSLPVELRLRIAEYATFEEEFLILGFPWRDDNNLGHKHYYKPSEYLALLLVCRQFHDDFTQLAYNNTKFVVCCDIDQALVRLHELPEYKIRNIRTLTFEPDTKIGVCERFLRETPQLQLHQLDIVFFDSIEQRGISEIVSFFRRLSNTKVVKFMYDRYNWYDRKAWCVLIGAMMKEDHYQRYDAPGAPNLEATWWDWCYSPGYSHITFEAQSPRSILPEEEYMLLMKPKVDALMAFAEELEGL